MKLLSKISLNKILVILALLNSAVLATIAVTMYAQRTSLFYIQNQISQDSGYVGLFRTCYQPGDTINEITAVYKSYDLIKRMGTTQFNNDIVNEDVLYMSFEIIDTECSLGGCSNEKILEYTKQ